MISLSLTSSTIQATKAIPINAGEAIESLLHMQGDLQSCSGLGFECLLFANWCVEVSMLNVKSGVVDAICSKFVFRSSLTRLLRSGQVSSSRRIEDVRAVYDLRAKRALGTVWNIYVKTGPAGSIEVPVTNRTSALFLRNIMNRRVGIDAELVERVRVVLIKLFVQCADSFSLTRQARQLIG
jgi:hypothetical protein